MTIKQIDKEIKRLKMLRKAYISGAMDEYQRMEKSFEDAGIKIRNSRNNDNTMARYILCEYLSSIGIKQDEIATMMFMCRPNVSHAIRKIKHFRKYNDDRYVKIKNIIKFE